MSRTRSSGSSAGGGRGRAGSHGRARDQDEPRAPDPSGDPASPFDLSRTDSYDYVLPDELIARYPADRRDASRLLVVPREAGGRGAVRHLAFSDLPSILAPGDLLVLNESRVLPVRLLGHKPTGAACEVLLLRPFHRSTGEGAPGQGAPDEGAPGRHDPDPRIWEALVKPGSKLKPGRRVVVASELEVRILDGMPGGARKVRLDTTLPVAEALERFGRIPLPPYLEREEEPLDRTRYQTVFARTPGSVAAPTAGLHFTSGLLAAIEDGGVETTRVTLHVGPGTFRPVSVERVEEHRMHREAWEVPAAAADAIRRTRDRGGRVWAVGTTVVRTLESAAAQAEAPAGADRGSRTGPGTVRAGRGETEIFISPGYRFEVVDGLITNFHLPRSTLLMLVSAFAGHRVTMAAYREAIRERYRFYSYGDAMALLPGDRR